MCSRHFAIELMKQECASPPADHRVRGGRPTVGSTVSSGFMRNPRFTRAPGALKRTYLRNLKSAGSPVLKTGDWTYRNAFDGHQ